MSLTHMETETKKKFLKMIVVTQIVNKSSHEGQHAVYEEMKTYYSFERFKFYATLLHKN